MKWRSALISFKLLPTGNGGRPRRASPFIADVGRLFNHLPGFFAAVVPDRRLAMRYSGTYNTVTDFILRPYFAPEKRAAAAEAANRGGSSRFPAYVGAGREDVTDDRPIVVALPAPFRTVIR